ncbi:MAG: DUF2314 domain-containing protein [Candidatus Poribacteria bacterium]
MTLLTIEILVGGRVPEGAPTESEDGTAPWRTHSLLRGRFHSEYPDDLQVIVHDGGPRISKKTPELVWVRVTAMSDGVFSGRLLNTPSQLETVKKGDTVRFVVANGAPHPVMATEKYLRERPKWRIHPCEKCGFAELFYAPSDLMRVIFPNAPKDSVIEMFTSFCPLCGGVQGVELKDEPSESAK